MNDKLNSLQLTEQ
jgi:hypothetical protein